MRREMRALLADISLQQKEAWSLRLVECLMSATKTWTKDVGVVALFGGLKTEPALLPLLPWLWENGRQAAFFAIESDGVMHPYLVRHEGELVVGAYGVLMPDVSMCPRIDVADLDVVLVPGLAFSFCDGSRLGRGKGYYDRVLAQLRPDARVIGVGYSVQIAKFIPREQHDKCVHSLVSEDGWLDIESPV